MSKINRRDSRIEYFKNLSVISNFSLLNKKNFSFSLRPIYDGQIVITVYIVRGSSSSLLGMTSWDKNPNHISLFLVDLGRKIRPITVDHELRHALVVLSDTYGHEELLVHNIDVLGCDLVLGLLQLDLLAAIKFDKASIVKDRELSQQLIQIYRKEVFNEGS